MTNEEFAKEVMALCRLVNNDNAVVKEILEIMAKNNIKTCQCNGNCSCKNTSLELEL